MTDHEQPLPPPESIHWIDTPDDRNLGPGDAVLSLAGVSEMFGVGRFQLRCYEALGLAKRRHRVGAQRVYGWADCERIALIIKARRAGLRLREIMPVVRAVNDIGETAARKMGLARCVRLIDRLEKRRLLLEDALNELRYACALMAAESAELAKQR